MKDPVLYVYEIMTDNPLQGPQYAVAESLSFAVDQFEAVTGQQVQSIKCLGKDTLSS